MSARTAALRARFASGVSYAPTKTHGSVTDEQRISALPTRPPALDNPDLPAIAAALTRTLKTPDGTWEINLDQAAGLYEALTNGSLMSATAVGRGKTLLGLLLPRVLNAVRTVLLVPAGLKAQLFEHHYPLYSKHFRLLPLRSFKDGRVDYPCVYVVTHNELSDRRYAKVLEYLDPDLIVTDEAHSVAGDSSRTTRYHRFAATHPSTRYANMSGTLFGDADDVVTLPAELGRLALRAGSPWPVYRATQIRWTEELAGDEKRRDEFRQRVSLTPGVVASRPIDLPFGLELAEAPVKLGTAGKAALKALRATWTLPDGTEFSEAAEFGRHAKELSQGFYYRWCTKPDEEWLSARRAWNAVVRRKLGRKAKEGMDSVGLLTDAALRGEWTPPEWKRWAEYRERPTPPTEAVWVDDTFIQALATWGETQAGLIFVKHRAVGERLAACTSFKYYPEGDVSILQENGKRTVVVAVGAFGTGWELQMFNRALVCAPSSSAKTWEQLLGRTHRIGQRADRVYIDIALHTTELRKAFTQAEDASRRLQQSAPGNEKLRLLYADRTFS